MAQHSPSRVGFALVLFLVLHLSQAVDKCKTGCDGASGALKLTPGTTYKYDYDGKISILLSSAEGQQTTTEVKAAVFLTQLADCSQVLKLQNVQVIGPDGKKRTGIPDIEKPVTLNNNNGDLHEFICAEPTDNQNSLNIKRAIASLFQANKDKKTEIDVFGQCPTQISTSANGDTTIITKNKDLNKCAFRESITHNYITSTFDVKSEIHSSPILSSSLNSKQEIKSGVLQSATVSENYLFVPFSVGRNGAKAVIESKLTLTGTSKDNPSTKCNVPKSIIFENPHPITVQKSNANIILKKIKEISETLGANVVDKTAVQFIDLVKLLRVSKKVDILSVYNQVRSGGGFPDKDGAKRIFLDAILVSGNGDTIEVAIELLKNKELGVFEERQLYLGLSRARHVTENSIKTATDLLNKANLPREAYLGIGSLAGRYCASHNCEKVDVVNKIIQKFLSKLGDLKAANRKEESDMIYLLKGITNIDYLNDAILAKLVSLAEDEKQPIRLRVATLEAFLAAPCKDKFRDSALKTLKDVQQDSEIRIKAYLVLTRCPNDKIGNAIKALLEQEKSNQVGGFISTHIKNLRSSTNPDKTLAKTHLGFIHTPNRFVFDPRKYSFNGEFSSSFESLGMANNVEGNVIYSQNSWLPRSTTLNLTAEVFGQRFNFLEVAARQENLDQVIEHYLGPQGLFRKPNLQQSWDYSVKPIQNTLKHLKEKISNTLRVRREVSKAEIDSINKKIQIKGNELDKNLDLDLSIKNFGYEILFMNSFETGEKMSPQKIIDSLAAKLNEGLDKLKDFEKIFRSNILFLDAELSYPTSLGFPLRLGIDGASNIQVKTEGSVDVRELLKSSNKDINLKLSLIPSATVTVTGRFSLDTPLLENGLKVSSTLHTSSGGDLQVNSFREGLGLDVKFSVPVQKQELIGLKHDIIFQSRENGASLNDQRLKFSQNKDFSICIDQLVNFIGLEFCADVNGPNLSGKKVPILPFPFSGDAKAIIRVEGGNINTLHYRREFYGKKDGKVGVTAILETLDKSNNRAVGLNLEGFISPEKYIKAKLTSPIKNAEAEARLLINDNEKVVAVYVKDEDKLYSAKAGLKVDKASDKTIFNPVLEYTTPDTKSPQTPQIHVEGKVIVEKNGNDVKYTFDNVKLVIPGGQSISVNGRLQAQPDMLKIQTEIKNTMNPSLNVNIRGEFKKQKEPQLISSNLQIIHGNDLNSKTNVISLINSFSRKNPKELEFTTKNKFSYPLMKINMKFDLDRTPKSVDYDTLVHYNDFKLGSELKLKVDTKTPGDYQLEFDLHGLQNKLEVKSSRQVLNADDRKIDHSISLNGKKLEVSGKVKYHAKPNDIHHNADLVIKIPTSKAPWKLNEGIKLNPREIDFHVKLGHAGSTPLIDTLFKGNRAGNCNGYLKVNFKDLLSINGQIKSQKGAGSGDILIDAKAFKKTAKAEITFTISKPTYNLDLAIYPVFNEDKNKKLVLSTKNKYTGANLDSESTVDILGKKFALNAKAQIGGATSGKTSVDVDLTLPDQQFFSGKLVRDISVKDGITNVDGLLALEQRDNKANPGRKITIKTTGKLSKVNADKWSYSGDSKITGSFLKSPIAASYKIDVQGTSGSGEIDLTLPLESLSNIKYGASFNVKKSDASSPVAVELSSSLKTVSANTNWNIDTQNNFKVEGNKNSGSIKYHGEANKPFKAAFDAFGEYKMDPEKHAGTVGGNIKAILPQNKVVQGGGSISRISPNEYKLEASLDLPTESSLKSNKISVHTKRSENNVNSEVELISNGNKYQLKTDLSPSEKEPSVNIVLIHPDGKISQLNADLKKKSDASFVANVKLACQPKDFLLEGGLEVNSENLDNFSIKLTANSPKLNVKNVVIKIGNSGNNGGKTINIEITSDGKNVLSGSATVSSREEQGKFIVEGSGNFKVENQAKSGNFKYIRTVLTSDKNNENGEEISFDATLGNKAIDAELKLTNKEFRYLNSYCEESKQCAHIEIDAKTSVDEIARFDNEIEITIDLRVLGIPNEFGLKAVTHRQNWLLDHTVDVHFENAANKYQYSLYVHPKEVGVSLTTPKRIIALEANANIPTTNLQNGGKASAEVVFYTDKKNNPNSKSFLAGVVEVDVQKRTVNAALNMNSVGQIKPLSIKYTKTLPALNLVSKGSQELIIDIFSRDDQKIVITQTYSSQFFKDTYKYQGESTFIIKSSGLGIDINMKEVASIDPKAFTANYDDTAIISIGKNKYDSSIKLSGSPKEANLLVKWMNQVLLEAKSDINLQKGLININTHASSIGLKPVESSLEIKNYNTLKFIQYLKDEPNKKLLITAAVIPGQIADARAEVLSDGAKKELFHASIKLDEKNFMQPDVAVNAQNIKDFSTKMKDLTISQLKDISSKVKEGTQKLSDDFNTLGQTVKETVPDTSKTQQFYESELNKFKEELAADKTLQDIGEVIKNVYNAVVVTVAKVIETVSDVCEKIVVSLNNAFAGVLNQIQTQIIPRVKEIAEELISALGNILDKVSELAIAYIAKVAEVVESIQPQLKAIAATLSELSEETGRFLYKTYESIKAAILEQIKHLKDELKASPLIAEIRDQYEDFLKNGLLNQEAILGTIKAICGALKEAVLVPEFVNVIEMMEQYIEKKLTNKPVDDVAELEKIGRSLIEAIRKFSAALSKEAVPDILRTLRIDTLNWDILKKLPNSPGALRVSLLDYMAKEDTTPLLKFLIRLIVIPQNFFIPTSFDGALLGSDIISFDKRTFHFPGTCSYLAVSDALNGNFSVVATYENKKLAAITLSDKSGSVTLKKEKVLLNNAETEYPVNKGTLHAYYNPHLVAVKSSVGAKVICSVDLAACSIEVSGYYHGHLRGLLGNGNNEDYDDLILPNGKIVNNVAEIAPAYAVGGSCGAVAAVEGPAKSDANCAKTFGWESSMSLCYPFVDPSAYKRSCEYASAAGDSESYKTHSQYYAYQCWKSNIPVSLPAESIRIKCGNEGTDGKPSEKAADVLLAINTNKNNEGLYKDYVQPLIGELINEFKAKGITDVQFHLIVYGGENLKPAHVTVKGKTVFKENAPNLKFAESPKQQKLSTGCPELDKVVGFIRAAVHEVKVGVGFLLFGETYLEVSQCIFRPGALHSIVVVTNDPCDVESVLPLQIAKGVLISRKDISFSVIMPVKNLKVKDAKTTKDVIGFNSENVITATDAKTKPNGSPALLKDLAFNNVCLDFTLSVGGNVYVAENLIANKNSKTQIIQAIAKNVVTPLKREA